MAVLEQLSLAPPAAVGLHRVEIAEANELLVRWGHYLGPANRPFHQEGWLLEVAGRAVSVAVSASTVSARCADRDRRQLVELARLCSGERRVHPCRPHRQSHRGRPVSRIYGNCAGHLAAALLVVLAVLVASCGSMSYREDEPSTVTTRCGETGQCEGDEP